MLPFLKAGGLMAGAAPTATRAMALNFGMLAFNASAKATKTMEKYPGELIAIGDDTTWFTGDYDKP